MAIQRKGAYREPYKRVKKRIWDGIPAQRRLPRQCSPLRHRDNDLQPVYSPKAPDNARDIMGEDHKKHQVVNRRSARKTNRTRQENNPQDSRWEREITQNPPDAAKHI